MPRWPQTEVPPALGPTRRLWPTGSGAPASEMSATVEDERLNAGRPTNIPLLVPGQEHMPALLVGGKPTREQEERAIEWALSRRDKPRSFDTIDDAVTAAQQRSQIKGYMAQRRSRLSQLADEYDEESER